MHLPRGHLANGGRKQRRPDVALLIETSNAYARGLLHGIRAYIREHRSWSIYIGEQKRGGPVPTWLKKWTGDGIIARRQASRREGVRQVRYAAQQAAVGVKGYRADGIERDIPQ